MSLSGLMGLLAKDPPVEQALSAADGRPPASLDISAPDALPPFVLAALVGADDAPTALAVTATIREAEQLADSLRSLLPADTVVSFPAWETLPHERLSPRSDTVGRRVAVLRRLAHPDPTDPTTGPVRAVVAPIRALLQPLVRGLGELSPVTVRPGDAVDLGVLAAALADLGYTRADLVERRSEFAVRGGIVDVFPPTEDHPLRLELWGDTVEEIRWFRAADQRSLEVAERGLWAPPVRELPLTPAVRQRARLMADEHPELADVLEQLAEGIPVEGMEALAPVLADDMELLVDALPTGSAVVVVDPERVRSRAHELVATSQEFLQASWVNAALGNARPLDLATAAYRSVPEVRTAAVARGHSWWTTSPFAQDEETAAVASLTRSAPEYRGDTATALADVTRWLAAGWVVVLVTEGPGPAARLVERLADEGVPARLDADLDDAPGPDVVHVTTASLSHGLVSDALGLAVLTETDLVGQRSSTKDMRRLPSRRRNAVDPLQLRPGDLVVHEQHGVGRYREMMQRTVQGAAREYVVIEYAPAKRGQPGDRLFVPTDQLDLVTRYVGGEAPALHRLGGSDWARTKGRARKAVRQIAAELIRLYSARMASPGHAFAPDSPWQRELEDAFPYVETPDQLVCIDEVKQDMEKPYPMDRLVCGDVGYGKTEIAVRAAFKAVQDGKQVAVLVPTTLLVTQHQSTFSERVANFPVVVRPLSRFQSDREVEGTLRGLADGGVDVVIGTHRLLQPSTRFKDLGLVVIDEEQRFGVEHKEYLKALRTHVDVLTMSATPIPRTLEMAVSGIRDMSTILTPPEERHPILTFVGPYDDKQVAAAIRRELLREGQVFYVHNRVESIERAARRLRELVPEARIEVAHGQMGEHLLEDVIQRFWERSVDVLVCTTIVENGLDISNANTLILERADTLGLAQLHQLRGRVGRGRERGYAYFMYPAEKPLTETAHDRLATIAQHTDLGAGMAVAMKDLEIRGAGNVLGGEQSGHVEGVGFDLYVRLVGEAVADMRDGAGGSPEEPVEVKVELPVDAHLPQEWIPSERVRLESYQRLADARDEAGLAAVRAELVDRFGSLPDVVERLLRVAELRVVARRAGLAEIVGQGRSVRFSPVELPESRMLRLTRLYPGTVVKPAVRSILVPAPSTARIGGTALRDDAVLDWAENLVRSALLDEPQKGPSS